MTDFTLYDIESAPESSKPLLESSVAAFGMIPNLHAVMAESPELLEAYQKLHTLFSASTFNAEEKTVVWQTINVANECHYCVPAHTGIAHSMKVDPAITAALRDRQDMPTEALQVLHETTLGLFRNRGRLTETELERFYAAGYNKRQLLEIVLGIGQKTLSNYTNHLADTPVDEAFQPFAWN